MAPTTGKKQKLMKKEMNEKGKLNKRTKKETR